MCKAHGWQSDICPECMLEDDPAGNVGIALRQAVLIIRARRGQVQLLRDIYAQSGIRHALHTARQWQNPMPFPVVICNF